MQSSSDKTISAMLLEDVPEFACAVSIAVCRGEIPQPRNHHKTFLKDKKLYLYGGTTDAGEQLSLFSLDLSPLGDSDRQPLLWK